MSKRISGKSSGKKVIKSQGARSIKRRKDSNYTDQTLQKWQYSVQSLIAPALGYTEEEVNSSSCHLYEAFTHRTYAHEYNQSRGALPICDNQRLEFLGDSILGYICTIKIYSALPHLSEGKLSAMRATLINRSTLKELALKVDFEPYLRVGRGESHMGEAARAARLADLTEAVIGAMYLDLGIERTTKWVWTHLQDTLDQSNLADPEIIDPKTELQHWAHRTRKVTPKYESELVIIDGQNRFRSAVFLNNELIGNGFGITKRESQRLAAMEALRSLKTE